MPNFSEELVAIRRCGPATTHSPSATKIITNVGGQPFGGVFGTLSPQMKTTGYLKPTKNKKRDNFIAFYQRKSNFKICLSYSAHSLSPS
jgi:hypothetical protein